MTTIDAMNKYGGSFAKAQKLIAAFPEIFIRYQKIAFAETEVE